MQTLIGGGQQSPIFKNNRFTTIHIPVLFDLFAQMYLVNFLKDDFVAFVRNCEYNKFYEPIWLGAFVFALVNTLQHALYTKLANAAEGCSNFAQGTFRVQLTLRQLFLKEYFQAITYYLLHEHTLCHKDFHFAKILVQGHEMQHSKLDPPISVHNMCKVENTLEALLLLCPASIIEKLESKTDGAKFFPSCMVNWTSGNLGTLTSKCMKIWDPNLASPSQP